MTNTEPRTISTTALYIKYSASISSIPISYINGIPTGHYEYTSDIHSVYENEYTGDIHREHRQYIDNTLGEHNDRQPT